MKSFSVFSRNGDGAEVACIKYDYFQNNKVNIDVS